MTWTPPRRFAPRAVHYQIAGVGLLALSALLFWNTLAPSTDGLLPRYGVLALRGLFGAGAVLVPVALGAFGWTLIVKRQRARAGAFWRGAGLALLVFLTLRALPVPRGGEFAGAEVMRAHGGVVGALSSWVLRRVLGEVGAYLALGAIAVASLLLWSEHTLGELGALVGNKWSEWRDTWKAQRAQNTKEKRPDRFYSRDEQLELWPPAPRDADGWPRPASPSLAEIRARNAKRADDASPFLSVGDWFPAKSDTPPSSEEFPVSSEELPVSSEELPLPKKETRNSSSGAPNSSDGAANSSDGAPPATEELAAPTDGAANSSVGAARSSAPAHAAPRIEIIQSPPPVSVLDLEELTAEKEPVFSPQELLEQQALESAGDGSELDAPRPIRIEKPRRHFGDGPLMPEYFDDGVRALDPPVAPDLEGAEEELQRGVVGVQETLAAFKIDARVTDVKRGPVITRYEVQPAPGVRVATIANLDRDLARSLSALAVRIEAPVPGKNVVGIEVPNRKVHLVRMRDVLEQHDFLAHPSKLAFVLGKDIAGQPKWGDLAKMPHLLIAGSTNSGKSVCLNSIIASILVRSGPEEVRFSLIDPKRVELTLYRGLPHLMHDVVVEPKQAVVALRRAIEEMDRRYRLFANRGVRNIASHNAKLQAGERPMPYIVIVIDELADLMMTAAAEFEKLICRLAQLARATGIHLIVATQRPSVNVITGVIKANIPARIAFAVASQVDSRTILDSVGAERLIGSGDMLFDANNGGKSVRIQGAFLSEEEVNRVVEVVKANYADEDAVSDDLPTFDLFVEDESDEDDARSGGYSPDEKRDSLYADIVEFCLRHNEMSASNIQRKFGIGYPRAGRIVDQLERAGVLSPADGPKPRKVLGRGGGDGSEDEEDG